MADKKTDFDELFGKKEPDRKPKKAAAPAQKKAPAQSRPSAAAAKLLLRVADRFRRKEERRRIV